MDDTTIITDADYISGGLVITGSNIGYSGNSITSGGPYGSGAASTSAATVASTLTYADLLKALAAVYPYETPEPPKPEAKPKKPPPALPVECWQDGAFDADRAWQATIAACKGVR